MGRFRYSGTNWEGRPWAVSQAIKQLGMQVEEAWPARHATDGTVAGKGHDQNSPSSDHRPHPFSGFGRVRAIDIGNPDDQMVELLRLSRDPRIKYVINKRRIFSNYDHAGGAAYTWRPYNGSNPHSNHVHVSVMTFADADGSPWKVDEGGDMAYLSEEQQKELERFLNELEGIDSDVSFVRYLIPWYRKWRALLPEKFLRRGDSIEIV